MGTKFKHVPTLLRIARAQKGLTQEELSKKIGYNCSQFISNIETGRASIPIKRLNQVCELLNIDKSTIKQALMHDFENQINKALK